MNSKIFITGAAAISMIAVVALAQTTPDPSQPAMSQSAPDASATSGKPAKAPRHMMPHHKAKDGMSVYAAPSAPIPYSDLSKYPSDEKAKPMSMKHKAMKSQTPDGATPAAS